jgi:hypothetical protein
VASGLGGMKMVRKRGRKITKAVSKSFNPLGLRNYLNF